MFFLAWVWPLANSQLGWGLLRFGRTASEALWQGASDPSQEDVCVYECTCTHVGEVIKQEVGTEELGHRLTLEARSSLSRLP